MTGDGAGETLDVAIIGAGLSGICAGYHMTRDRPDRRVAIFEAREAMGGTWDLFRYPGIRSDSDMPTLGYGFRPWTGEKAIADGPSILRYIRDSAAETGVDRLVRHRNRMVAADWDGAAWVLEMETPEGRRTVRAKWLFLCTGYYDYAEGYRPDLPGLEDFAGEVIHPQHWPDSYDPAGKRIVVVGSGATAVTLVPELAREAAQVTMLQRSPTHIVAMPSRDKLADAARRWLGDRRGHALTRWKNIVLGGTFYRVSQSRPDWVARMIRRAAAKAIGPGVDPARDLTPRYAPWDQRLCLVPDGDLFAALRDGTARIVTDRIARITADGVETEGGHVLDADTLILATGLKVQVAGGARLSLNGESAALSDAFAYRGVMYSGMPNLSVALGYINASWTLKCELIARYTRRLLDYMETEGLDWAMPEPPPEGTQARTTFELSAGYLERARDIIPKQTDRAPWRMLQSYVADRRLLERGDLTEAMTFGRVGVQAGGRTENSETGAFTSP